MIYLFEGIVVPVPHYYVFIPQLALHEVYMAAIWVDQNGSGCLNVHKLLPLVSLSIVLPYRASLAT